MTVGTQVGQLFYSAASSFVLFYHLLLALDMTGTMAAKAAAGANSLPFERSKISFLWMLYKRHILLTTSRDPLPQGGAGAGAVLGTPPSDKPKA